MIVEIFVYIRLWTITKEKVSLKFTGYEYGIKITRPDKVAKIAFSA